MARGARRFLAAAAAKLRGRGTSSSAVAPQPGPSPAAAARGGCFSASTGAAASGPRRHFASLMEKIRGGRATRTSEPKQEPAPSAPTSKAAAARSSSSTSAAASKQAAATSSSPTFSATSSDPAAAKTFSAKPLREPTSKAAAARSSSSTSAAASKQAAATNSSPTFSATSSDPAAAKTFSAKPLRGADESRAGTTPKAPWGPAPGDATSKASMGVPSAAAPNAASDFSAAFISSGVKRPSRPRRASASTDESSVPPSPPLLPCCYHDRGEQGRRNNMFNDFWYQVTALGGGAVAFLYQTLRSDMEKEVDRKVKEKELKEKDRLISEKEREIQNLQTRLEEKRKRWHLF